MDAPGWVLALPTVNAALNAASAVLLVTGLVLIRSGRARAHMRTMLASFAVSIAFLACYLVYHFALAHYTGSGSRRFEGTGAVRGVYFAILISHVTLAAVVPVLASMTIYRALRARWPEHKRLARVTFPIWLYVSVTGVIIYGMLYHWPSE